jgi:hypothetical protein
MKTNLRRRLSLEHLEPRNAPATLVSPTKAIYQDVDGDVVTITFSKPILTPGDFNSVLQFFVPGVGGSPGDGQLGLIDLTAVGAPAAGTSIAVAVTKASPTGDGLAHVGRINATGLDLGNVTIKGDLADIDCGDADTATPALDSLHVRSMGRFGLATQGGGGDLSSCIFGPLGSLSVDGDLAEAIIGVTASDDGTIGSVRIGGSIVGGSVPNSGQVQCTGAMGPVFIGGDIMGGSDFLTGAISGGKVASVTVGGSVIGGSGNSSGSIVGVTLGPIRIRHDLKGGLDFHTGSISATSIAGVTVGGSILGGLGLRSGSILSTADTGQVNVAHDVVGGRGDESGKIDAAGKLAGVSIGGSLVGSSGREDSFTIDGVTHFGQIFCLTDTGPIIIGHDVHGGSGGYAGSIICNGSIARVTIEGSLIGGDGETSGVLRANKLGLVAVQQDVCGGAGSDSGSVVDFGNAASIAVGGSLIGGSAGFSGEVRVDGTAGSITIGHDLQGGRGAFTGIIDGSGRIGNVAVGGSVIGGTNRVSGIIRAEELGTVTIGRDLIGGSVPDGAPDLPLTGYIESEGRIASVEIGGSIIAGTDNSDSGALLRNASIRAQLDIGSLTVHGSLIGKSGAHGDSFVIISARGQKQQGATNDLAIGKMIVGGRVELAQVYAGYDRDLTPVNPDAQVGSIIVGGDWVASSMIAGTVNLGADDAPGGTDANADNINFGDAHDQKIGGGTDNPSIISRIGSITVAGQVYGTPSSFANLVNHFGFVAERIGTISVGGGPIALQTGSNNDGRVLGATTNMRLHELDAQFNSTAHLVASAKLVNSTTVAYTDADGDHVTATISRPLLTPGNVNDVFKFDNSSVGGPDTFGQQLQQIDLTVLASDGLNVTVSVSPSGGDRLANVGAIDSTGFRLGSVTIPGDLGRIDAGAPNSNLPGVQSLSVRSMGRLDVDTQAPGFNRSLESKIESGLGSLRVSDDIVAARLAVTGPIGSVVIGGSLIGGNKDQSGYVSAAAIGAIRIGRDLQGGSGNSSGNIDTRTKIGSVAIGGSLIGGPGGFGARLVTDGSIGPVAINGNLLGGAGQRTGLVEGDRLSIVTIGGSLVGGSEFMSGQLYSYTGSIGDVQIAHNLVGGIGDESGKIDCGGKLAGVTIKGSLVGESGAYDTITDANGVDHSGQIFSVEDLGVIKINHDLHGGAGQFAGCVSSHNDLVGLTIGGSLVGGSDLASGAIQADNVGTVRIGHDLIGGSGNVSGEIDCSVNLASATIGGSLIGGSDPFSGGFFARGDIGPVMIGHDLLANHSGNIFANGKVFGVQIGGSLVGGIARQAGLVRGSRIGTVTIRHNLLGGSVTGNTATLDQSGYIESAQDITSVTIGGSVISGIDNSTGGSLTKNASIRSGTAIGTISVQGSLIGNVTPNGRSLVIISATGPSVSSTTANIAIGNIMIGGRVERANIFAGYSTSLTAANDGVEITSVSVSRDWIASNLVAGMQNLGADDLPGGLGPNEDNINFGDVHDTFIGLGSVTNRISRISIGGLVAGTAAPDDHFGFTSHAIGSFKAGAFVAPLSGAFGEVIELSPLTEDATIREV